MEKELILKGNLFKDCSFEELKILYNGLENFYEKGWFENDNPLTPYKNQYCKNSPIGVFQTEMDLLRAITVNCMKKEENNND